MRGGRPRPGCLPCAAKHSQDVFSDLMDRWPRPACATERAARKIGCKGRGRPHPPSNDQAVTSGGTDLSNLRQPGSSGQWNVNVFWPATSGMSFSFCHMIGTTNPSGAASRHSRRRNRAHPCTRPASRWWMSETCSTRECPSMSETTSIMDESTPIGSSKKRTRDLALL